LFYKIIFAMTVLLFISSCSSVVSKKIGKKSFTLTESGNDSPFSLTTNSLKNKAWQVCPKGFDVITKNAYKKGQLGKHQEQCITESCDFVLEWKIICSIKPKESFSIFGSN